jgi:hypothetical protein
MEGNVIGNVNILDLRNATEESIAGIEKIENANAVLFTQGTGDLLAKLDIGNVNVMVDVPPIANVQRVVGKLVLNRDHFKELTQPVYFLVTGQLIVDQGVSNEDIDEWIAGSFITGQLICPESIAGTFQSKDNQVLGQVITYPSLSKIKLDSFSLTENVINTWDDDSDLAVVGDLSVPEVLPNKLLEAKLGKLFVSGKTICHEENAQVIQNCLMQNSGKLKVIPAEHKLVNKSINLDATLLENLPERKLYCIKSVQIGTDVTPDLLNKNLESIFSEKKILCPEELKSVFVTKCNLLENQIVFFEGRLWMVRDNQTLKATRLEYMDGDVTAYITGELTLDPDITPELLSGKFLKVHNLGVIRCTPEQMGVIDSLLGLNSGELHDLTEVDDTAGKFWIDNANYLAL